MKWDSSDPKERLAAVASRTIDLMSTGGGGPLEGKVVSPGITAGTSQPLNLRSLQERISLSGLLGSIDAKSGTLITGPCWTGTSEGSLLRLVSLLDLHFEEVRECNPDRWDAGAAGTLCTNLGVGSHIRLIAELIRYVSFRDHIQPITLEANELYDLIKPLMGKIFSFIRDASEEDFKARFKSVVFGSTGYHQYFFQLFNLVADDIPSLRPDGYDEYQKMTSRDLAESADRNVKWIQTAVPAFIKAKLRERVGESWFEQAVSKEVQKTCQARRIDADPDEKLAVEEYLDWIQFVDLARNKEIRDDVKDALSIRLADEPSGKHFYAQWFDTINRLRRVAAHPRPHVRLRLGTPAS